MPKCPSCGAVLEVNLTVGTDFTKTHQILAAKASGADLTNEQLTALKWKQSQKKASLATILVTQDLLNVPLALLLYDRLRTAPSKSWKLADMTYKLSENDEGTQWIQRWSPIKSANV